jgi:guanylate kinase
MPPKKPDIEPEEAKAKERPQEGPKARPEDSPKADAQDGLAPDPCADAAGRLTVVSAPSGTGKTSLINAVRCDMGEDRLAYSVSHTTRTPRPGEVEGKDYYFVGPEEFAAMAEGGEFLEWTQTFGNSYGTSRARICERLVEGVNVVADVDITGAASIKRLFPKAILVFIAPPSFSVLKERLLARNTETPEAIEKRLTRVREEIDSHRLFDFLVINDVFRIAKNLLMNIIATGEGPPMSNYGKFWERFFG